MRSFEHKYGLTQTITTPTRCTAHTNSILDLILTNSSCIAASGTLEVNLSDHQPSYIIRKHNKPKPPLVSFKCRSFNGYVKDDFQQELADYDWTDFFCEDCVDTLWDTMERNILQSADIHCPYREHRERKELKPWLTPDLLETLKERDRLYRVAKRTNDPNDWILARKARNSSNQGIRNAKNEFVKAQLVTNEADPENFGMPSNRSGLPM